MYLLIYWPFVVVHSKDTECFRCVYVTGSVLRTGDIENRDPSPRDASPLTVGIWEVMLTLSYRGIHGFSFIL